MSHLTNFEDLRERPADECFEPSGATRTKAKLDDILEVLESYKLVEAADYLVQSMDRMIGPNEVIRIWSERYLGVIRVSCPEVATAIVDIIHERTVITET